MTRIIIITIVIFFTQLVYAQKSNPATAQNRPPTRKDAETDKRNHNCVRSTNKTFTTRLKNYPFNNATQIQLVSFKGGIDTSEFQNMKIEDSLPRLNDTVCYSKLIEVKNITYSQVDKLTDILYNWDYAGPIFIGTSPMCYFPRNAILFLDRSGKVFEFIEICFECRDTRLSSKKIYLGAMCDQKMEMLKSFFKDSQVEYGITKGLRSDN